MNLELLKVIGIFALDNKDKRNLQIKRFFQFIIYLKTFY